MASSEARRRKQLEKKKKKRADKHREIVVRRDAGLAEQLSIRSKAPIYECLIGAELEYEGIGQILMSRQTASGEIVFAVFLIDRYCMGVKDCFANIVSVAEYRELRDRLQEHGPGMKSIDPSSARRIIEDSVDYANELGLKPTADYRAVRMIFGNIDPSEATVVFEMGWMDGKPHFIAGPFQSEAECRAICAKLTASCGDGGFHYTIPMRAGSIPQSVSDRLLMSFDDSDEDYEEDFGDAEEMTGSHQDADSSTEAELTVVDPGESRRIA